MNKKQFQVINNTLNDLQKAQLIDIADKSEDIDEKENEKEKEKEDEEGIDNNLEKHDNLNNNTNDDHLISK